MFVFVYGKYHEYPGLELENTRVLGLGTHVRKVPCLVDVFIHLISKMFNLSLSFLTSSLLFTTLRIVSVLIQGTFLFFLISFDWTVRLNQPSLSLSPYHSFNMIMIANMGRGANVSERPGSSGTGAQSFV